MYEKAEHNLVLCSAFSYIFDGSGIETEQLRFLCADIDCTHVDCFADIHDLPVLNIELTSTGEFPNYTIA
ncbi:hypothetical protein Pelo_15394 [Pelomyxa schiedti]|nr:hypothetical protein Pelo_15394 [Pelomyxa schiedti]